MVTVTDGLHNSNNNMGTVELFTPIAHFVFVYATRLSRATAHRRQDRPFRRIFLLVRGNG